MQQGLPPAPSADPNKSRHPREMNLRDNPNSPLRGVRVAGEGKEPLEKYSNYSWVRGLIGGFSAGLGGKPGDLTGEKNSLTSSIGTAMEVAAPEPPPNGATVGVGTALKVVNPLVKVYGGDIPEAEFKRDMAVIEATVATDPFLGDRMLLDMAILGSTRQIPIPMMSAGKLGTKAFMDRRVFEDITSNIKQLQAGLDSGAALADGLNQ